MNSDYFVKPKPRPSTSKLVSVANRCVISIMFCNTFSSSTTDFVDAGEMIRAALKNRNLEPKLDDSQTTMFEGKNLYTGKKASKLTYFINHPENELDSTFVDVLHRVVKKYNNDICAYTLGEYRGESTSPSVLWTKSIYDKK